MKANKNTNIKNKNNNNNKPKRRPQPRKKRRTRPNRNRIPAAYVPNAPKIFNNVKVNGTSALVTGCDLVYKINNTLNTDFQNTDLLTIIPSNPAYWTGTRVSAIASGYQNYRPLKFQVHYVPVCAVTQQGCVIGGTLWHDVPSEENLQQTLKTSNGGMITQCYKTSTSVIKLGTNLQQNLFRMAGMIDQESNPFIYIALSIATTNNGSKIIPGYFYVSYQYQFKNPIGQSTEFKNSQLTSIQSKEQYLLNAVLYLAESIRTANGLLVPTGSMIDIEYNNNPENPGYNYLYNGTPLDVGLLRVVWVLENQPHSITTNLNAIPKTKNDIYYDALETTINETAELLNNAAIVYPKATDNTKYEAILNTADYPLNIPLGPNVQYYKILNIDQNFGKIMGLLDENRIQYEMDKIWTRMINAIKQQDLPIKTYDIKEAIKRQVDSRRSNE